MKKTSPCMFLFAKDDRTMTSGWKGTPEFRRYGRELVSKPAISLKKDWGSCRINRTTPIRPKKFNAYNGMTRKCDGEPKKYQSTTSCAWHTDTRVLPLEIAAKHIPGHLIDNNATRNVKELDSLG